MVTFLNIIIIFFCFSYCKIVRFNSLFLGNSYNFIFRMSSPDKQKYFELCLTHDVIFTRVKYFDTDYRKSVSVKEEAAIDFGNERGKKCKVCSDTFRFGGEEIMKEHRFNFLLFEEEMSEFDCVGLQYKIRYPQYSFIHQLYSANYISRMAFGIGEGGEWIYFEDFPKKEKKKYSEKCYIDKDYDYWGCKLNYIKLNNELFPNTNYAYLEANEDLIFAPKKYYDLIIDHLFSKHFKEGNCLHKNLFGEIKLVCKGKTIEEFLPIYFGFGGIEFNLSNFDLFSETTGKGYKFKIEQSKDDNWKFGTMFFREFPVLFDYDNGTVSFYSDEPFSTYQWKDIPKSQGKEMVQPQRKFFLINIFILSSFTIMLAIKSLKLQLNKK